MLEAKRTISQNEYPPEGGISPDAHDAKKQHSRPGRKPTDTEPALKRTAQNRAAQRAYRERKERKMQDLEDKVKALESETVQAITRSDFLKAQVDMLQAELARYRGHSDFSDLRLPNRVGPLLPSAHHPGQQHVAAALSHLPHASHSPTAPFATSHPDYVADFPWSRHNLNKQPSSISSTSNSMSSSSPTDAVLSPDSSILSKNSHAAALDGPRHQPLGKFDEKLDSFCTELNKACGTLSCPVPKDRRVDPASHAASPHLYTASHSAAPSLYGSHRGSNASIIPGNNTLDIHRQLLHLMPTPTSDGTLYASNPDPNATNSALLGDWISGLALPLASTHAPLPAHKQAPGFLNDPMFHAAENGDFGAFDAPNPFAADGAFDVSLAFLNDNSPDAQNVAGDPLSLLIDEESAYDPFKAGAAGKPNSPLIPDADAASADQDDDEQSEIVPAPEQQVQCSEIWDRITSHARYTEIDIDGLCAELKTKAKCSEKGVVVNSRELDRIIQDRMAVPGV